VVAVFRGYNYTYVEKTPKHTNMYLITPVPMGKGQSKTVLLVCLVRGSLLVRTNDMFWCLTFGRYWVLLSLFLRVPIPATLPSNSVLSRQDSESSGTASTPVATLRVLNCLSAMISFAVFECIRIVHRDLHVAAQRKVSKLVGAC